MHEWALAEAVISAASEVAEKKGLKEVKEVHIRVGEMQQIDQEILKFALSQLRKAALADAKFIVGKAKARFRCRVCGYKWVFNREKLFNNAAEAIHFVPEMAHTYIRCPKCGSPDFEVTEGRGIWLESIKGER
jgi:hydrogenase nickel incorporation protein HypA/HybF